MLASVQLDLKLALAERDEFKNQAERLRHQHGVGGGFLRGVRTLRGLSLDELARSTRISARYLSALEDDAFDRLPSATFVRGYLRQVTAVLELEGQGLVDDYMTLYRQHRG